MYRALVTPVMLLALLSEAWAQDVAYPSDRRYLRDCRFDNGVEVPADECAAMRKAFAAEQATAKARAAQLADINARLEAQQRLEAQAKASAASEAAAAREAQRSKDVEAMRQVQARMDEDDRAVLRQEAAAVVKAKAVCGGDYKNPSIGMTVERLRQCVSNSLKIAGQVNRADGIVTTYTTSSGAFFHMMNGKVIAWGR